MMHGVVERKGCPLAYTVTGDGPPLVFIQGVGIHASGCNPQVEELSGQFRCLTFDNRGIGLSQPAAAPISVDQMVEDTLAVMNAAGMEAAHIAGHSLGGMVAQQMACTARNRVLSLCLLCTSAHGRDATRLAPDLIWLGIRSNLGPVRARRLAFLRIVLPDAYIATQDPDPLAARLATIIGHDLGVPAAITFQQMRALRSFDSRGKLAGLAGIPTLVIAATNDRIFPPRFVKALAKEIPGAKYAELEGAHGVTIQRNQDVNRLLGQHLSSPQPFR